ncbi:MAG TPA: hypothetical protein VLL77_05595, partial [Anaerolineales bacterium]|nr:hypothetical protein [Anaerolineales bacterium]
MRHHPKHPPFPGRVFLSSIILAAASSACVGIGSIGARVPTQGLAPATFTAAPPAPPPTPAEIRSPSEFPLSEDGPWLVYASEDGLMIANPAGSGKTQLFNEEAVVRDFSESASLVGGLLAFYSFDNQETGAGATLQIIRLPYGTVVYETPLLTPSLERAVAQGLSPGSPDWQAVHAIARPGAMAWSPDGQQLAFVAALSGPSSDLYVYDLAQDQRRRVTSGPNQVANLSWSPDVAWIANQAVESFGPAGEERYGAVWAVNPRTSQQRKMYTPRGEGEVLVGWSLGDSLISYSLSADGPRDLRASGAYGTERIILEDGFSGVAYDPKAGTVAVARESNASSGLVPGARLWNPVGEFTPIHEEGWDQVQWAPAAGRFYFSGARGVLAVDPETLATRTTELVGSISPSPDGRFLVLWGNGEDGQVTGIHLLTADLEAVSSLGSDVITAASWLPSS